MTTYPLTRPAMVALPAEIDVTNARDVRAQLTAATVQPGVQVVIADMTGTTFCDNSGVRALVQAHQRAARNGTELRLLRPCVNVMRVLEMTGFDQMLTIRHTLEDAMLPDPAVVG
jgi:anti-sigma B factor antagonist